MTKIDIIDIKRVITEILRLWRKTLITPCKRSVARGKGVCVILILLNSSTLLFGQEISGIVYELNDEKPVEFVSISITGKNVNTVSDKNGKYTLQINPDYYNDTLRFSRIGYNLYEIKVSDFLELNNGNVVLKRKISNLEEVVVDTKKTKNRSVAQRFWGWLTSCRNKEDGSCDQKEKN